MKSSFGQKKKVINDNTTFYYRRLGKNCYFAELHDFSNLRFKSKKISSSKLRDILNCVVNVFYFFEMN